MYDLRDIAEIIDGANLGAEGQTLFQYASPVEVKNCIILYPSNDPPIIDPQTPGYFVGKFQTIVRNSDHEAGLQLCKDLADTLTLFNYETANLIIKQCRPLYQARVYRRAESGLLEFSVGYKIHFIEK